MYKYTDMQVNVDGGVAHTVHTINTKHNPYTLIVAWLAQKYIYTLSFTHALTPLSFIDYDSRQKDSLWSLHESSQIEAHVPMLGR